MNVLTTNNPKSRALAKMEYISSILTPLFGIPVIHKLLTANLWTLLKHVNKQFAVISKLGDLLLAGFKITARSINSGL